MDEPQRTPWDHRRRSRHERGYGSQWDKLRKLIMEYDRYLCQPCKREGRITPATEVDHITPKAQGGEDDADNLQSICATCHKAKTAQDAMHGAGHSPRRQTRFDENGCPIWPE